MDESAIFSPASSAFFLLSLQDLALEVSRQRLEPGCFRRCVFKPTDLVAEFSFCLCRLLRLNEHNDGGHHSQAYESMSAGAGGGHNSTESSHNDGSQPKKYVGSDAPHHQNNSHNRRCIIAAS